MSRKLRIEYPGAMYHVMNRGDQREDIFRDDQDRQKFLATLGEACAKTEWQMARELERLGWDEVQVRARPKGHRSKVMLARRLRVNSDTCIYAGTAEPGAAQNGGPAAQFGNSGFTERPPSVS